MGLERDDGTMQLPPFIRCESYLSNVFYLTLFFFFKKSI